MASRLGMAIRNEQANNRIDAALARLATGKDMPAVPEPTRDAILRDTLRLEWIAAALESMDQPTSEQQEPEPKAKATAKKSGG